MNHAVKEAVELIEWLKSGDQAWNDFPVDLKDQQKTIITGLELLRGVAEGTHVIVPEADYETLLEHAKISENIFECETCGAWLDRNDPAVATTDDYTGCWKVAAGQSDNGNNCRSYRSKR